MCRIFEKIANDARAEGKAEGIAEGMAEGLLEAAKAMLDAGLVTFDQVAKSLKLTKVQRQALQLRVGI